VIRALVALCALAGGASAQSVDDCFDHRSSLAAYAEPWDQNTRLFANGAVRLVLTDTLEPAAAAFHLVIFSPPYNELGDRQCVVVSMGEGLGFAGLTLDGIEADYDPAIGLIFALRATRYLPDTGGFADAVLRVTLNQSTGLVTAQLD
jgi:hypothetical protein